MTTNWVGWMISGIVLLLLFAVAAILKNSVLLLITGERSQGVVVGMDTSSASLSNSGGEGGLQSPIVEFVTSTGERVRVSGRTYSASPSARVGDAVTVAYDPSLPQDAQFLLWREFPLVPAGFILGFTGLVLLIWISFVLLSGEPAYGDPFALINAVISHFRMNPYRFPVLLVLSAAILGCGLATYITSRQAIDLYFNGIKAVGHVIGSQTGTDSDGMSSEHPVIVYKDAFRTEYEILGSASSGPLSSPLKTGDKVEVLYLARNPEKGVVNDWSEMWLLPLVFGSFTILFLLALFPTLHGTNGSPTRDPRLEVKLKTSGVPVVATVIEADPDARSLYYRIDIDDATADLHGVYAFEKILDDWKPSPSEAWIKKGDQFRAYLDLKSLKPGKTLRYHIDFSDRVGFNPRVQSMEEEEEE